MKKTTKYLLILLLMLIPCFAFARIPKLVTENKVQIENPDIPQAFYAELKGKPDNYEFSFDKKSPYYIGLLVPKIDGADKDYSFKLSKTNKEKKLIAKLSGKNKVWSILSEPFTGDIYFQGPEIRGEFEPGKYKIKVKSPDNKGKYILAIGEKKQFLNKNIIAKIKILPKIKHDYLGKSYFSIITNGLGLFLLGAVLILTGIIIITLWLLKFFKTKN